jgi:hypothetical protein
MSEKSKTKKSVTFNETPLVRQYSNDYSADRKANSQSEEEKLRAVSLFKAEDKSDKISRQLAKEEEERRNTMPEDSIQITRTPSMIFSVKKNEAETNLKNKGAWHKFKKMTGITKSSKGGKRKNRKTRKNRKIRK